MKKTLFFLLFVGLLFSCKTQENIKEGVFNCSKNNKNVEQIVFRSDGTFKLTVWFGTAEWFSSDEYTTCTGQWKYVSKDTIFIHCTNKVADSDAFERGYITQRTRKIKIISRCIIKMEPSFKTFSKKYIVLKRISDVENRKK
jgi:hypothetical protein